MESDSLPADRLVEEISSLCMQCHADGTTRLLLTRIPFFRDVVLMSFSCPECGFQNSEIQSAGEIQQRGVRFSLRVDTVEDLQRQVVKSDTCVATVPALELEIPAGRGQLTNVEGLLSMVMRDLEVQQDERRRVDEDLYSKIQGIIQELREMVEDTTKFPFAILLDDPAGNSSIEPSPADTAGKYARTEYPRTPEQNAALGLAPGQTAEPADSSSAAPPTEIRPEYHATQMYPAAAATTNPSAVSGLTDGDEIVENEVYTFPSTCPGCTKPCATNMKMVRIPHFDEVVIMSTVCHHCGYRSNEVKSGGAVPDKGRRITLRVLEPADLSRDILKAESCALTCPELSLTVEPGTLGGRFTTVEGLLTQVRDDLRTSIFGDDDGAQGDSMPNADRAKWTEFFGNLDRAVAGRMQFTVVLEDPLAGSYVQSFKAPEPDEQITVEEYERTEEEEEHLGLRDIKTEGYEQDAEVGTRASENTNGGHAAGGEDVEAQVKARLASLAAEEEVEGRRGNDGTD